MPWRLHPRRVLAEIGAEPSLGGYGPLLAAKGDFLMRLGRMAEARAAFGHAASLRDNAVERALLLGRADRCGS